MISRKVTVEAPEGEKKERVLEFGVTGALYNSNVLFYDREDRGLWSQLLMEAVSGPLVGTALDHLPSRVLTLAELAKKHPGARIVSRDPDSARPYDRSPYTQYFRGQRLMVPVREHGEELEAMTAGIGVLWGDRAWFVAAEAIGDGRALETPAGEVRMSARKAGDLWAISVDSAPEGVRTAQTFYFSWSAFYPRTEVIAPPAKKEGGSGR